MSAWFIVILFVKISFIFRKLSFTTNWERTNKCFLGKTKLLFYFRALAYIQYSAFSQTSRINWEWTACSCSCKNIDSSGQFLLSVSPAGVWTSLLTMTSVLDSSYCQRPVHIVWTEMINIVEIKENNSRTEIISCWLNGRSNWVLYSTTHYFNFNEPSCLTAVNNTRSGRNVWHC